MLDALATFEIIKVGLTTLLFVCIFCSAIYGVISSMRKNYQKTSGNITTDDVNKKQIITYTVEGKEYTQSVLFKSTNYFIPSNF